jgi:hypothetical protein
MLLVTVFLVLIQAGIGMVVNLYVTIPSHHPGAKPSNYLAGPYHSVTWPLPGSLKNLLDWTIGDDHTGSIYDKPGGWVNASPRGADRAYGELRTVLAHAHGHAHAHIDETACVHIPITTTMIGPEDLVKHSTSRRELADVLTELAVAMSETPTTCQQTGTPS